jgi:hypothetical protein
MTEDEIFTVYLCLVSRVRLVENRLYVLDDDDLKRKYICVCGYIIPYANVQF